jgi:hypothetical protein
LTAVRVENPFGFFPPATVKIPVANTTLGTRDYLHFLTNFLSDKIWNNEMGGPCDKYTGKKKFLQGFGGEA